ncbi:MAG: hydrogenase subunit MbhD domain-containing protein [Candidatus Methanosuratincola sp.]
MIATIELVIDLLLAFCVVLTAAIVFTKDLLLAVVLAGAEGVLVATVFYLLLAPDIALVQVAAGVGISTALFIVGLRKIGRREE